MYQFPIAAITINYKLSGLKKTVIFLIVLKVREPKWVSLGKKQGVSIATILLTHQEETISLKFLASRATFLAFIPWFIASCSIIRASREQLQISPCFHCHHIIFSLF